MAIGTGQDTLQTVPDQRFVSDPNAFARLTKRRIYVPLRFSAPGGGASHSEQLPQAGIISKAKLTFVGSVTISGTDAEVGPRWPYGLVDRMVVTVNGSNEIVNLSGEDLHALRYVRYPSYSEDVDMFDGSVGGNAGPADSGSPTALADGTHDLHLTWEIPFAIDDVSLIGSLYAQSAATSIEARVDQVPIGEIVTLNTSSGSVSGTFHIELTTFEVPVSDEGKLVTPDLSMLHALNANIFDAVNAGENRVPLVRSSGQLARLFLSAEKSAGSRLSGHPSAADSDKIDSIALEYGARVRPYVFDPASSLMAQNNMHYGGRLPYDRLVIDQMREHPVRDAIHMQGLTELASVLEINSSVSLTAGRIRMVQESLFSAGNGANG